MASVVAACFSSGLINPVSTPGETTALTISSFSDSCLLLVAAAGRISSEVVVDADQELVEQRAQQTAHVGQQPRHPPAQDTAGQESGADSAPPAPRRGEGPGPAGQQAQQPRTEVPGGVDGGPCSQPETT